MTRKTNQKKVATLRGRGDYTTENKITDPTKRIEAKIDHIERSINKSTTAKGFATAVGRQLGKFLPMPGGEELGAFAGEGLARLFGKGDFKISSNSLIPGQLHSGSTVPKFDTAGKRGTRIVEREYLGDIFSGTLSGGATVFSSSSYSINPTALNTFPWLSTIASQFDQWEPNGIVFEFISTSSEYNGSSQALGTVIMSTDYDFLDAPFTSKLTMENADFANSTKPSLTAMHGIECDPKERPFKVLYTSNTVGDARMNSLGNFQLATLGCSVAGVNLGELWISYDITFYKKQLSPSLEHLPFFNQSGTNIVGGGLLTGLDLIYGSPVYRNLITLDNTTNITLSTIRFDPSVSTGRYFMTLVLNNWRSEVLTLTFTNCSAVESRTSIQVVGDNVVRGYAFNVLAPFATIGFPTKLTGAGNWVLTIIPAPPVLRFF